MRKFSKMLAASVLVLLPAGFASAQGYQGGGGQDNGGGGRQFRQYGGQNNDQGFGGDRQSRRQFNADRQFGGNNGGYNGGGYGNNNGGFSRQRSSDFGGTSGNSSVSNSSSSSSSTVTKSEPKSNAFVPPVATGPFTFTAQPLPQQYTLLNNRSIFSKDHRSIQPEGPKKPVFENAPVAALVLRGARQLETPDNQITAQIEDINSSKAPTWVVEGQVLTSSGARVVEITLDHIVVEKNGIRRLITLGVNLDQGEKMPTPSSGTASATASSGADTSQVKIAASSAGNTSEEDVADMMRRRRQQELGQE